MARALSRAPVAFADFRAMMPDRHRIDGCQPLGKAPAKGGRAAGYPAPRRSPVRRVCVQRLDVCA
jgi:hypothetical protein